MSGDYIFDTGSALGREHMDHLEQLLDAPTTRFLDDVVRPGQRCLELGAGGGSIAGWLTDRVGPAGSVVAVDTVIDHLAERPGLQVFRHDLNDGLPVAGPYDLIHARLVLLHLPRRKEIFKILVDALAPGGWLVLGDFTDRPLTALEAPRESDKLLWARIQYLSHEVVSPAGGIDFAWAYDVDAHMAGAGLVNLHGVEYSMTTAGGGAGCMLHWNLNTQAEPLLLQAGATPEELARYRELMCDPRFRAWFYQFMITGGQKVSGAGRPAAGP